MNKKLLFSLSTICAIGFGIAAYTKWHTTLETIGYLVLGAFVGCGITLSLSRLEDISAGYWRNCARFGAMLVTAIVAAALVSVLKADPISEYATRIEMHTYTESINYAARLFTLSFLFFLLFIRLVTSKTKLAI